jgi:predicted nicotinamide N-methyase
MIAWKRGRPMATDCWALKATGIVDRPAPAARATEYTGPVVVTTLEFGGRAIRLVRPADPDRLLDDPSVQDWNRRDDYMPYWAYLWPGACLLAEAVVREPWPLAATEGQSLEALEIGCGVGLAGLVALGLGLRVCFTDYDEAPLRFVDWSTKENDFDPSRYETRLLDWRNLPAERYPVILGSDVLYERRLVPQVASLLATMLAPGGLGLIACPGRASAEGFLATLTSLGVSCRAEPITAKDEDGQLIRGMLYRVGRTENHLRSLGTSTSGCCGRTKSG